MIIDLHASDWVLVMPLRSPANTTSLIEHLMVLSLRMILILKLKQPAQNLSMLGEVGSMGDRFPMALHLALFQKCL